MELKDLVRYAKEKYGIEEEHKWKDFPNFSILRDPYTDKWVALLMRQYDPDTGEVIEKCDLKCGRQSLYGRYIPYLSLPYRMKGDKWLGISFEYGTDSRVVYKLFDRAVTSGEQRGYTIVLSSKAEEKPKYQSTMIDFGKYMNKERTEIPDQIRKMMKLYEYKDNSHAQRCKNFYWQGKYMENYEDDLFSDEDFSMLFPVYHDLNIRRLRGFFAWRTALRKGDYRKVNNTYAYMYLYELLNGIGAKDTKDSIEKMKAFEKNFIDSGLASENIRVYLRRWMSELALLENLPAETVFWDSEPELYDLDKSLMILKYPEIYNDDEVFQAMNHFQKKQLEKSLVLKEEEARGKRLYVLLWRKLSESYREKDMDIFTAVFGEQKVIRYYPLANAVYYPKKRQTDREYIVTPLRKFHLESGLWYYYRYDESFYHMDLFKGLLHEAERRFRICLNLSHPLIAKKEEAWVTPYIDKAIEEEKKEWEEARKPKINIDFSSLGQIRSDAVYTEKSLLTEEELKEENEPVAEEKPEEFTENNMNLTSEQLNVLKILLKGEDVKAYLKENHLMASVLTDAINEAFYEEIGDSVVESDDEDIMLVEDYVDDVKQLLRGSGR